ncbi:chromosomal replication initiator protein DnaA [Candidatus Curtissbacteria bacterium]|nr:chromosomal replication initiator protein DnaA [Candidatus Curtissbacteria bacterium]
MDGQKVWSLALAELKNQFSASSFKTWFSGSYVLDVKEHEGSWLLVIGVPNSFVKEQLEKRYFAQIETEIEKQGTKAALVFVVAKKTPVKAPKNEPIFSGEINQVFASSNVKGLFGNQTFNNFVVGFSNNLAYLVATQVAKEPGRVYNPLLIYGPTGVGKTHLLQAIGNELLTKSEGAKVMYVSAEKFTNEFVESLRNKTQEAFRHKYRKVDLLLVDDIQFLSGKEGTQDEFFFTINELFMAGKQVVCASDRHPRELGKVKERLVSRFLGGMAADISLPDLEMKMAIVQAKCREKGVSLPSEVIAHMAQSCVGGARELEGSLVSVLAQVKLAGGKVDIEALKISYTDKKLEMPAVTPGKIIDAVCKYYKVRSGDICGVSRKAALVRARQTLMYLLRKELDLPLVQIGQLMGGRDHSTIFSVDSKILPFLFNS